METRNSKAEKDQTYRTFEEDVVSTNSGFEHDDEVLVNDASPSVLREDLAKVKCERSTLPIEKDDACVHSLDVTELSANVERLEVNDPIVDDCTRSLDDMTPTLERIFEPENGYNKLHAAAAHGNRKAVSTLVKHARHKTWLLDRRDSWGTAAVHWALGEGHVEVAYILVEAGASPLLYDAEGMSALHMCCAQGDARALFNIITRGFKVRVLNEDNVRNTLNALNNQGMSGFHLAVSTGNTDMIKLLKAIGVNINAGDGKSGRTALHFCVEANNKAMVEYLLEDVKVNPNTQTFSQHTALDLARGRGFTDIAELLISHDGHSGDRDSTDSDDSDNECFP